MEEILENVNAEAIENAAAEKKVYSSREEILTRLEEIASEATDQAKGEINYLKMLYYKMRQQETDQAMQAFIEGDGDPSTYQAQQDELEPKLKELLNRQKEVRAAMVEQREKQWAENLVKRQEALKQMQAIVEDPDQVSAQYTQFRELEKQFKEAGDVDPQEVTGLWKQYTKMTELFYDTLRVSKELRDYDYKKNQEQKESIIAEAEKLQEAGDVVQAFRKLQELHEAWRECGPVSPEVRDEMWNKFKAASTVINKRHQDYFENVKAEEIKNEEAKKAICDKMEQMDTTKAETAKDWDELTKFVLELQKEWRTYGFASKKVNTQLYERYRALCDTFFAQKAACLKGLRDEQRQNLELRKALIEKAEALMDSTEWRATTDKLIALQKEWKEIGTVAHKQGQETWDRFKAACDKFFEAKKQAMEEQKKQAEARNNRRREGGRNNEGRNNERNNDPARKLNQLKAELKNYENNMLMFSGKGANAMLAMVEKRIAELKAEIAKLEK